MIMEDDVKKAMQAAVEHLREELKSLRTGRANPGILDNVNVEVYGTQMRLRDIANITIPESRQLLITPYDANNTGVIAKAIEGANLNLQPMIDGNVVRINIPPMDESVRKDMVKLCKKKEEEAKVSVRDARRKFNEMLRKEKAGGEITEDIQKKSEKMVQDFTDKFCKEIDNICSDKEKEILEI